MADIIDALLEARRFQGTTNGDVLYQRMLNLKRRWSNNDIDHWHRDLVEDVHSNFC